MRAVKAALLLRRWTLSHEPDHFIAGKDGSLESTIATLQANIAALGIWPTSTTKPAMIFSTNLTTGRLRICGQLRPWSDCSRAQTLSGPRLERGLITLLTLTFGDEEAVIDLYVAETLHTGEGLINDDRGIFGLDSPGLDFESCKLHRA